MKPNTYTVTLRPFVYSTPSVRTSSICICVSLLPQIIMLCMTKTYNALAVIFAAVLACLAAEGIYNFFKRTFSFSWLVALMQGVMIGLLLPAVYPPVGVFLIVLCSMMLTKYAFGGFSSSWVNPVAITVALCYVLNMAIFPAFQITGADLQARNASFALIQRGAFPLHQNDESVTNFLNDVVFKFFDMRIPEGYVSLFWDSGSIIPAFRFNVLTIITSLVLFAFEMIDILIPAVFLFTYALLVRFLPASLLFSAKLNGDILLAVLTSGTLFGTLFILQWYGTSPKTLWGKLLYAFFGGIAAFFIVGYGMSPIGYIFTVLVMNLVSPVLQVFEQHQVKQKLHKNLMPRLKSLYEEAHYE